MEGLEHDFHSKVKNANIIVTGKNFGCGSSREHAPIALSASGIEAILALSFARIFYRNSVDGAYLLPFEIDEKTYSSISENDELEIDTSKNEIKNITKNQSYSMKPFPDLIGKINQPAVFSNTNHRSYYTLCSKYLEFEDCLTI